MSRYRIKQKRRLKNTNERLINQIGHELSLAEDELNEVLFGASCTINNEQELNEGAVSSNLEVQNNERYTQSLPNDLEVSVQNEIKVQTDRVPKGINLSLPGGTYVVIHSLNSGTYNGKIGEILYFDKKMSRYIVKIDGVHKPAALKCTNLRPRIIIEDMPVSIVELSEGDQTYSGCVGVVIDCDDNAETCEISLENGKVVTANYSNLCVVNPERKHDSSKSIDEITVPAIEASSIPETKQKRRKRTLRDCVKLNNVTGKSDKMGSMLLKMGEQKCDRN